LPKISVEDWVDISNLLGRYQWLFDRGDGEAWATLFTEDGVFEGLGPTPFRGHEALKQIPPMGGYFRFLARHMPGSIWMEYGEGQDEIFVHLYNLFSTWLPEEGPRFQQMADCTLHLARIDGEWKLKSNVIKGLLPPPGAVAGELEG
jgi:hypothetical protein